MQRLIDIQGRRQGGAEGAAAPPLPTKKRREGRGKEREKKKKEKRGTKRERKLNLSFQEHAVMGLYWPPDPSVAPRPPAVMTSAFRTSRQPPPLSQNPAYAPGE